MRVMEFRASERCLIKLRIDCLDRKLTAKQLEDLQGLVALLGFRLTPLKASKPKLSIWARRRIARSYKGHPLRSG